MTIAELFIKLGITGGDKAKKELKEAESGMKSLIDSSLAAKAAVAGVIIGLERLTGWASQAGMNLTKFGVTTGLSTQELQKWQYAMNRFDVSGEETEQTIRGIQDAITDMKLGKGAPGAIDLLAQSVGLDTKRVDDTFYMLTKLQQFAKKEKPGVAHNLLKDFGISENVFQALKNADLSIDKLEKRDMITPKQIQNLTEINKRWKDFWFMLQTFGKKFVADVGLGPVTELTEAFRFLVGMGRDVVAMFDETDGKAQILKATFVTVATAIALAFAPVTTAITGLLLVLSDIQKYREGKDSVTGKIASVMGVGSYANANKDAIGNMFGVSAKNAVPPSDISKLNPFGGLGSEKTAPITNNVNTTIHASGVDHVDKLKDLVADHWDKHLGNAAYQSPAQAGGF